MVPPAPTMGAEMATTTTCDICGDATLPALRISQEVSGGQWLVHVRARGMVTPGQYAGGDLCLRCLVVLTEDAARLLRMGLEDLEGGD